MTEQKKIPVNKPMSLNESDQYEQREEVRFVLKQLVKSWDTRTAVFQERHFSVQFSSDGDIRIYQQDNQYQRWTDGKELAHISLDRKDPEQYTVSLSTPKRIIFTSPYKEADKDRIDFNATPKEIQQWDRDSKNLAIVRKATEIMNKKSDNRHIHTF